MFSFNNLKDQMPEMTAASMFSAYASVNAFIMLLRSIIQQLIPEPIRTYIYTKLSCFFTSSSDLTLVIDEYDGATANMVYGAAEIYLKTIAVSPTTKRLRAGKSQRQKTISFAIHSGENVHDTYDGLQLTWRFKTEEPSNGDEGGRRRNYSSDEKHRFELKFHRKHKDIVMGSYLPHVLARAEAIREEHKVVKLYSRYDLTSSYWTSVNLEHPSTFDTMALDPAVKTMIVDDLRRFVRRKEFYKRVGKAWKRGYLLYGPPGTGKSSLIAAMANFLKFHVYDLELTGISSNQELRRVLLNTANRSILVIEDVDCAGGLLNRKSEEKDVQNDANSPPGSKPAENSRLTLSGILNFIDGLWSSCGDERIIVFTTNHKDRLDPALLRPGRMDVHIHLSYCTASAFDILASNYLGMGDADRHPLCREIKGLMEKIEVTPAEVAEEMMKSEDVEVVLAEILSLLHRKKDQSNAKMDESEGNENPKRQKADQIVDDDGGAEAEEHFLGLGFCTQE